MLPSRSKTPADKSPASRTEVENAVRTSVCACSSTTAIRRDHMICRWICESAVLGRDSIAARLLGMQDGNGTVRRYSSFAGRLNRPDGSLSASAQPILDLRPVADVQLDLNQALLFVVPDILAEAGLDQIMVSGRRFAV